MKIGTKSILFGVHSFWLHPWFVALAWTRLYGFPFDPRLWVAFFVHDLGYLGKPNMDGPEGEKHVELGARVMNLFGPKWRDFSLYHSRYYAKRDGVTPSRLCIADKLSFCVTPKWLYLPLAHATGEIHEYMARAKTRAASNDKLTAIERAKVTAVTPSEWFDGVRDYLRRWAEEHRDGKQDTWTMSGKAAFNEKGVWK
jgi:hypothetical protein